MPRKLRLQERFWDEARESRYRVSACRLRRTLQLNHCGSGEVWDPEESYEGEGTPQNLSLNKNGCGILSLSSAYYALSYCPQISRGSIVTFYYLSMKSYLSMKCKRIGGPRAWCLLMCKLPNSQLQSKLLLSHPSTTFQLMATDCQSPLQLKRELPFWYSVTEKLNCLVCWLVHINCHFLGSSLVPFPQCHQL